MASANVAGVQCVRALLSFQKRQILRKLTDNLQTL
jgi:hypothetical protein